MEKIKDLQKNRSNIRNICILAHVDHGKTTLADSLVASNGIISQRQAGKVRYMDSREDEQLRGITMKSSAIALHYNQGTESYLVNLIDSPGHVDFSSEVSTAVRLCDGALVVVDAVEGVCPQTQVVLQQAWAEGIKLCLVINKVDRLITELQFTPTEAYYHLQQVLEQVNAVTGSLFSSKVMEAAASKPQGDRTLSPSSASAQEGEGGVIYDWSDGLDDIDDSSLYFSPEQGNVIFASALDGWGFSLNDFAVMHGKKLGIREEVLKKTLWGNFYLNTKSKRIFKGAQAKGKKPLFVQFILDNVWAVYKAVIMERNKERIEKIVSCMNLKISARDSRHTSPKVHLFAICSQWLPLTKAVLDMVVASLPSPLQLTEERVERLLCSSGQTFQSLPLKTQLLKKNFLSCGVEDTSAVMVFVSKLFAMDKTALPQHQNKPLTEEEIAERRERARQKHRAKMASLENDSEENIKMQDTPCEEDPTPEDTESMSEDYIFLAFSRVFSGVLKRGQQLFILQPQYDPRESILDDQSEQLPPHVLRFTVGDLYILMGRSVVPVDEVPAGNVAGIAGLEDSVIKSATLSSTLACPAFGAMNLVAAPIVRVAIEPLHVTDLQALVAGMKLLNQADPSVEVYLQESGEHILAAAGEVHLQMCLNDLKNQYARIKLKVSAPIIPFRETVVPPPTIDMVNEEISSKNEVKLTTKPQLPETSAGDDNDGGGGDTDSLSSNGRLVTIKTAGKTCTLQLEACPLPAECVDILKKNTQLLKALNFVQGSANRKEIRLNEDTLLELRDLRTKLNSTLNPEWEGTVDRIWSFGPRHTGPNILMNAMEDYDRPSLWSSLESDSKAALREFDNSIISGFQLATLSGPLCEEPMYGVCVRVKDWSYDDDTPDQATKVRASQASKSPSAISKLNTVSKNSDAMQQKPKAPDSYGPFSGQLISAMKEGCRRAFLAQPARLMVAMYSSNILATADVLGKVYGVLGRRNGKVLSDEMREGTTLFNIQALVPVAESFGFAEEIRKKTSGLANPQLIFSHWEVIPYDPFWVPSTEEELLHFGEKADSDNVARKYINAVRKRKGLHVDEKIVEYGEKQRTLKKNK